MIGQVRRIINCIRTAEPVDADEIGIVHCRTWQTAYRGMIADSFLDALNPKKSAERFRQEQCQNMLVAEENGRIVGFTKYSPCRDKDLSAEFGEVDALYVLPEKQGGGFGRKLMSQAMEELRRQGFQKAMLWVVAANQHAIQFYEKNAYHFDGTQQEYDMKGNVLLSRYVRSL